MCEIFVGCLCCCSKMKSDWWPLIYVKRKLWLGLVGSPGRAPTRPTNWSRQAAAVSRWLATTRDDNDDDDDEESWRRGKQLEILGMKTSRSSNKTATAGSGHRGSWIGCCGSFLGGIQRLRVSEKHRKKKRLWLMAQNVRSWQRQHASPAKREKWFMIQGS